MVKYSAKMDPVDTAAVSGALLERPEQFVDAEERLFREKVLSACDAIVQDHLHIILLTGPSASGKTTTAKQIALELTRRGKKVDRISLDNFYRPSAELPRWEDGYQNYESVEGLDIPFFERFVAQLFEEGHGLLPVFDFTAGRRRDKRIDIAFDDHTYLIFEGIHALNPVVTTPFSSHRTMKIYISVHSDFVDQTGDILLGARDLRLCRRLLRDYYHRGTEAEETLQMWDYVLRGEDLYIRPFRQYADIHINSTHAYEPYLYHDPLIKLLAHSPSDSPHREIMRRLSGAAPAFFGIPESLIPRTSLIQEFLPKQK